MTKVVGVFVWMKLRVMAKDEPSGFGRWLVWDETWNLCKKQTDARSVTLLYPSGHGFLMDAQSKVVDHDYGFRWSNPDALTLSHFTEEELAERIKGAPAFEFARRFWEMSFKERVCLLWQLDETTYEKVPPLLKCALLAHEPIWRMANDIRVIVDFWAGEERANDWDVEFFSSTCEEPWDIEGIEEVVKTVFGRITPELDESLIVQHNCLSERHFPRLFFDVEITEPTAHERLEAAIQWREWLASTREQSDGEKV